MNVTTGTRNLVYQRDNFQCIHCGSMKDLMLQGRAKNNTPSIENIITICRTDSARIANDQSFSDLAVNYGWKLRTWEEPSNREVYYQADGEWFYLTERGTRIKAGETADNGR